MSTDRLTPFPLLRLATLADVPALDLLIPASARALQLGDYSSRQIEGAIGTVFGVDTQLIKDQTYFVAETNEGIVGCGGWSRRKTLFGGDRGKTGDDLRLDPASDAARLRAFFVHPACARQGIGRAILQACEVAAAAAGFSRIEIVATLTGEFLYAQFNYQAVERFDLLLSNGEKMPVVRMARSPPAREQAEFNRTNK